MFDDYNLKKLYVEMIAHVSVFLIRVHGTKLDGDGFITWVSQKAGLKEKAYMLPFYKGSSIRGNRLWKAEKV